MVAQWQRQMRPWSQTPTEAVFNFNEVNTLGYGTQIDKLFVVDKQSVLPKSYEVRLHRQQQVRTIEYLQVEFGRPLPPRLGESRQPREGYLTVDATKPSAGNPPANENVVSEGGLTVQMVPLAMDEQGDVLVDVRGWLGGAPMDGSSPLMLQTSPSRSGDDQPNSYPYRDDMGRRYLLTTGQNVQGVGLAENGAYHLVFSPAEPRPEGTPPPDTLTVRMGFGPSMAVKTSGGKGGFAMEWLFEKEMTFTVSLPKQTEAIDPRRYVSAASLSRGTSIGSLGKPPGSDRLVAILLLLRPGTERAAGRPRQHRPLGRMDGEGDRRLHHDVCSTISSRGAGGEIPHARRNGQCAPSSSPGPIRNTVSTICAACLARHGGDPPRFRRGRSPTAPNLAGRGARRTASRGGSAIA